MTDRTIECPLCGTSYQADARIACSNCPIGRDCQMVCCPNCGHTTIDPAQSSLVHWVSGMFANPAEKEAQRAMKRDRAGATSLAEVKVGFEATILDLSALPEARKRHLNAYGLSPGARVSVRQQSPVTIFEIDQTELALDNQLATKIKVKPAARQSGQV